MALVLALAASLAGFGSSARADALDDVANWQTECVGYYTVRLPAGGIEYALNAIQTAPGSQTGKVLSAQPVFSDGLGAYQAGQHVDSGGVLGLDEANTAIKISAGATADDLAQIARHANVVQRQSQDELLRKAQLFDEDSMTRKRLLEQRDRVRFFEPFGDGRIQAIHGDSGLVLYALVGGRIVNARRQLNGSPRQTIDTFLGNYQPRADFEWPAGPGVCLPHAFMMNESEPATVGVAMRLLSRPDIVVYLRDAPAAVGRPGEDMRRFLSRARDRGLHFYAAQADARPLDETRPARAIRIDGREGMGVFVAVRRLDELAAGDGGDGEDWAFVAYVPGDPQAPKGASSDLVLRVERFARFSREPMSQAQFRQFVDKLAANIHRRPGAREP